MEAIETAIAGLQCRLLFGQPIGAFGCSPNCLGGSIRVSKFATACFSNKGSQFLQVAFAKSSTVSKCSMSAMVVALVF